METTLQERQSSDDVLNKRKRKAAFVKGRKMRRKECTICSDGLACVCFGCWRQYLADAIESKGSDAVTCPECELRLNEREIKKLADSEAYDKWLDKAAKSFTDGDEEFRACPSASCSRGCFFSTKEDGNIFTCQMCKYRWCVLCEVPMHDDQTCADYQDRLVKTAKEREKELIAQNEASEKVVETESKACPNCTFRIQKNGGCDHMTCRRCSHQFCWMCSAAYKGARGILIVGNKAHQESCRYSA